MKEIETDFSFKVDQRAVDNLTRDSGGPTGQLVRRTGQKAADKVRTGAPVDTGALKGSITQRDGHTPEGDVQAEIVVTAPHWRFVEWGTRYQRPQPFLRAGLTVSP